MEVELGQAADPVLHHQCHLPDAHRADCIARERPASPASYYHDRVSEEDPFGGMFGDPEELRRRFAEMAEQMQGAQRVAWADNAIRLAVEMTVAAINRLDLTGGSDEQAVQVRDAIRIVFPEAVTLVREAREGLA